MTVSRPSPNREALERVARRLGPLLDRFVFVGGSVAELLVTDPAAVRIRATDDVDVIVAITSRTAYYRLGEKLRERGFVEDTSPDAPLCRWRSRDQLALDVMPTDETILGFTNPWYVMAIEQSVAFALAPNLTIQIPTAPVFLATKWAAYEGRGANDLFGSHDIEDIIVVVAGRPEVLAEIAESKPLLRTWLAGRTQRLLANPLASDVITGALPDARTDPSLIGRIRDRLQAIANMAE